MCLRRFVAISYYRVVLLKHSVGNCSLDKFVAEMSFFFPFPPPPPSTALSLEVNTSGCYLLCIAKVFYFNIFINLLFYFLKQ